jgi:hypothetical protein
MAKLYLVFPFGQKIESTSRFYKNCHSVRNRGGKICQSCPFREYIEAAERRAKEGKESK